MAALAEWFKERPKWMIKAANRLLEKIKHLFSVNSLIGVDFRIIWIENRGFVSDWLDKNETIFTLIGTTQTT